MHTATTRHIIDVTVENFGDEGPSGEELASMFRNFLQAHSFEVHAIEATDDVGLGGEEAMLVYGHEDDPDPTVLPFSGTSIVRGETAETMLDF